MKKEVFKGYIYILTAKRYSDNELVYLSYYDTDYYYGIDYKVEDTLDINSIIMLGNYTYSYEDIKNDLDIIINKNYRDYSKTYYDYKIHRLEQVINLEVNNV
jgi:hypothetical protein